MPRRHLCGRQGLPRSISRALSEGCEGHHFHNAMRNSLRKMRDFLSNGIRDPDNNQHSFSDAEPLCFYCLSWTYASR